MVHDRFCKNYDILKAQAREAPLEPGVYIMKDSENRIIYVGKARKLRTRLATYFSGARDVKTAALIGNSKSIETIIVSNEYEALLLENTLIKQHSPKYNINLKDGKTYPVVRVTADAFPRVFRTRHIIEDGSEYFGPFANVQALDKTLELIEKLFPLRKCRTLKKRDHPCMYYHISRCLAPCCKEVPDYPLQVDRVRKLLAGESAALIDDLSGRMREAAEALRFEEAAGLRNAIRAVETLSDNNSVQDMDREDRDYIAWAAEGIFTTFTVLSMRNGRMIGRELFSSRSAAEENETLDSFIAAYYTPDRPPPPRIFMMGTSVVGGPNSRAAGEPGIAGPAEMAAAEPSVPYNEEKPGAETAIPYDEDRPGMDSAGALNRFFTEQFGYAPELVPAAGKAVAGEEGGAAEAIERRHIAALAMAHQNAQEELRRRLRERGAGPALDELVRVLGLKTRPERIEGFDIAQLDGKHPVASMVSFRNGIPDRKNYRYFKLRTVIGKVDDFASMREAVQRRYSRLVREGRELPDLVLIDGGIGQVNAARGVMEELGIDCDLAGLAKRDEEIWLPHKPEPVRLSKRSEALKVLQFVRDETHRFATSLNQKLRSKDLYFPILESIDGIGPKRAAAIIKTYGGLEKIAAAKPEEMAEQCGVSAAAARAVRAAARLALEDRNARKSELAAQIKGRGSRRGKTAGAAGKRGTAAALADEALGDRKESKKSSKKSLKKSSSKSSGKK